MSSLPKKKKTNKKVKVLNPRRPQLTPYHILPNFMEVENLVRFATLLYILALLPLVSSFYRGPQAPNTYLVRNQETSSVLGEEYKPLAVPQFPKWRVELFSGREMTPPSVETVEVLPFVYIDLDKIKSYPIIDPYNFSIRLESKVDFETGIYTFQLDRGEGNIKVYIDKSLILDSKEIMSPNVYLGKGFHEVRIEYQLIGTFESFSLDWSLQ